MIVPHESQQLAPKARVLAPPSVRPQLERPRRFPAWARVLLAFLGGAAIAGAGAAIGLARFGGAYSKSEFTEDRVAALDLSALEVAPAERAAQLEKRLAALSPRREIYLVVDSFHNRLRVYKGGELLREAVCSTGSGVRLRDPRNGKEWVFDTPQGELRILRKVKNPVWVKPDWAFIEEGFEPPKSMRARIDDFSLGDYGLYMRDGYIIHGTIFKTLLGKRVTHGCIRLGDEDLEFIYKTVPAGARVFLF